jgi:hypothetical protein
VAQDQQPQQDRDREREALNDAALRGDDQPGPGGVPEALSATLPGTELRFPAMLQKVHLDQASNGLTYTVQVEAPVSMTEPIVNMRDALTFYWLSKDWGEDAEPRLVAMGGMLKAASVTRDPDGNPHLVCKYLFSQDQVLVGVGVVASALALDETEGSVTLRSDQLTFSLAAKA